MTQEILNGLKTDFLGITTDNGFTNTIVKCHETDIALKDVKDFDSIYIQGGMSKGVEHDGDLYTWTWMVGARFFLNVNSDPLRTGLLGKKIESIKEDVRNLFRKDLSIMGIPGVESAVISYFDPYLDTGDTKGTLDVFLEIIYSD